MKRFQVGILTICMMMLFSDVVLAKKISSLSSGNWRGGAYSNDRSGRFSHCAASVRYKSGILLLFSVTRTRRWKMGLSNSAWNLRRNNKYNIEYRVDGNRSITGTAVSTSGRLVQVSLPTNNRLFRQFKNGRRLTVWAARQKMVFTLQGTRQMLSRLLRCANYYIKRERNNRNNYRKPSDPFSPRNNAPRRRNNSANPFEASFVVPAE